MAASPCAAQTTRLVSHTSDGGVGNGTSMLAAISGDGRYVCFQSHATDLVPGDANGCEDVFRRDLWTGELRLVSAGRQGGTANRPSRQSQISRDGRFVVFTSYASDLVPGDGNGKPDIFVRDLGTGSIERVSVSSLGEEAHGGSRYPYISGDGRMVAFECLADNLVPGDTNGFKDVFVHDRLTGSTQLVSRASDGGGADAHVLCTSISADGRRVGFSSAASNLVPGDTNAEMDAFVHDLATGRTVRASVDVLGREAHGLSADLDLSADGRFAVFGSFAPDLVPGDTNGVGDVFVKDLDGGGIERISVSATGAQGDWDSYYPRISGDGGLVVFFSGAGNLVAGDANWSPDVFARDLRAGTIERISVAPNGHATRGEGRFTMASDDGRYVAFECRAPNLSAGDDNSTWDVFVRDRAGPFHASCAGDGSAGASCPCANPGGSGRGCASATYADGALLEARGWPAGDAVELVATDVEGSLVLFLQGRQPLAAPATFGSGLLCAGGTLLRLYGAAAADGAACAPPPGMPSLRERAQSLGDSLPAGEARLYQACYRARPLAACPSATFGATNAVRVHW